MGRAVNKTGYSFLVNSITIWHIQLCEFSGYQTIVVSFEL